ncbi:hypothetical protein QR680_012938 [Steinernema hermaphroditum]|uniref:Uncharacterized protein n=1 Tax=Steinernema hermaphroditum TaxID=289476 RepID=A0AA39I3U0_9BILA|nr:hypothetical protein QR680_012938 [Steinernema hermaphroditum]
MEEKVVRLSAPERVVQEGFLDKVKNVIGSLGSSDETSNIKGGSFTDKETMEKIMPQEREAMERIQREKAQSELINSIQKHVSETGGELDADKIVETLARKKNLEEVDVRSLTIGGCDGEGDGEKGEEGILVKVRSAAKSAFEVLTADPSEKQKTEVNDELSRRSSSTVVEAENLTSEECANLEKIQKEKEHSELLNKVQKKKIQTGEETFDPLKAQDDLRRQEPMKKPQRQVSKSSLREKSVEKKPQSAPKK